MLMLERHAAIHNTFPNYLYTKAIGSRGCMMGRQDIYFWGRGFFLCLWGTDKTFF